MAATPPPVPRITGDQQTDLVSLVQWMNDFYRATVLENAYADQADTAASLSSLTDPANGTVATAQSTANSALLLAQSDSSRLDVLDIEHKAEEAGEVTISGTANTATITLTNPQADTSYFVTFGGAGFTGAPAAAAFVVVNNTKQVGQFDIALAQAPGASNSVTLAWAIARSTA